MIEKYINFNKTMYSTIMYRCEQNYKKKFFFICILNCSKFRPEDCPPKEV